MMMKTVIEKYKVVLLWVKMWRKRQFIFVKFIEKNV